ncbi:MAG: hypothetical protein U0441_22685 [Polyangiaceae bacterium]
MPTAAVPTIEDARDFHEYGHIDPPTSHAALALDLGWFVFLAIAVVHAIKHRKTAAKKAPAAIWGMAAISFLVAQGFLAGYHARLLFGQPVVGKTQSTSAFTSKDYVGKRLATVYHEAADFVLETPDKPWVVVEMRTDDFDSLHAGDYATFRHVSFWPAATSPGRDVSIHWKWLGGALLATVFGCLLLGATFEKRP